MKKRPITGVHLEECKALKDIYMSRRKAFGLTQEKAAEALGITQGSFSHYLNGRNAINIGFALRVAKLLDVTVESFSPRLAAMIAGMANASAEFPAEHEGAAFAKDLLEKFKGTIPPRLREQLLSAAKEVAEERSNVARKATIGDRVRIAHYDVQGAMGGGQLVADFTEMLPDVVVSQQHLRELGVSFKDINHLKVFTGLGQSMAPTIQHLDPLIGDISIRDFQGDGIYAFIWQGHFFIKSLQLEDADHFLMVSKNSLYPPKKIRMDDTYIQAKVLLVWNATRV